MKLRYSLLAVAGSLAIAACADRPDDPAGPGVDLSTTAAQKSWVVVFKQEKLPASVEKMVADAGGTIVSRIPEIGAISARSANADFGAQMKQDPSVRAANLAGKMRLILPDQDVGATSAENNGGTYSPPGGDPQPGTEPLWREQWDKMRMNVSSASYAIQKGRRDVVVAILDTGLDQFHPDIAPNLDLARSMSFVPTEPTIQDFNGHGTWCGSAVAAPLNNFGISGVAPEVTLVALKVLSAADGGEWVWLAAALVYAGVHHFDIASMSLGGYIPRNTDHADYIVLQRAVQFARSNGVLPIAALGNDNFDVSDGRFFQYFVEAPGEIAGVIGVSATGYFNQKAHYSNYGMGKTDISAPGGATRDYSGVPGSGDPNTGEPPAPYLGIGRVLGAWSTTAPSADLPVDRTERCTGPGGTPPCFMYVWIQGTSMATPNAAGVAALIISQYGDFPSSPNRTHMSPTTVEQYLQISANNQPCPTPNTTTAGPGFALPTATCSGDVGYNNYFGKGIVDAMKALTLKTSVASN
jgi:subtilisin family serine protease